ncbi:MAG: LCP family protein [Acidimicrobiales bacterium]
MAEGDQPTSDEDLWNRLAKLPDADQPEPLPHDNRSFRVSTPAEPTASPSNAPQHSVPPSAAPPGVGPDTPEIPIEPELPWDPDSIPTPLPESPGRRRTGRRRAGKVVIALAALAVIAGVATSVWSWVLWDRVEKIDTEGTLSAGTDEYTNYLIVGTDSREGVPDDLKTSRRIGLGIEGERSDTMVVLHIDHGDNHMVSLPRDLWVNVSGSGPDKLNAARALGGVPALIRTIQTDPGIPIHHYLEVDIAGFLNVIDAVGSITIRFSSPACDPKSGLNVRRRGAVELDPEQALAYVRSRTYTEFDRQAGRGLTCAQIRAAGLGTTQGNSDIGRTERQRAFLLAVFDKIGGTRNPVTLLRVLSGLTEGLKVDDTMSMFDAINLMRDLRNLDPTTHALPVVDFAAPNGSSALALSSEAPQVLVLFGPN